MAAVEWVGPRHAPPLAEKPRQPGPLPLPPPDLSRPLGEHAADYAWLVGCLSHDRDRGTWSVRYADPGEPDRYGGILDLVGPGPMTGLYPGQLVRVHGELVDPVPLEINPAYRVRAIQVLPR
jgi:hypothetical protein